MTTFFKKSCCRARYSGIEKFKCLLWPRDLFVTRSDETEYLPSRDHCTRARRTYRLVQTRLLKCSGWVSRQFVSGRSPWQFKVSTWIKDESVLEHSVGASFSIEIAPGWNTWAQT